MYVCENCYQIKYPYESFLNIFRNKKGNEIYCGECVLNTLKPD